MSNQNIVPVMRADQIDLQEQFRLCEGWDDPDQWDALGVLYYQRGYDLNALNCFKRADTVRASVAVEMEVD